MAAKRNPGAVAATGASKSFNLAVDASEDSQTSQRFQAQNRYRSWWQASTLDDIDDEDLRLRCAHFHKLGPRPTYEFVKAVLGGADVLLSLEAYERLDGPVTAYLGGSKLDAGR